MIDTFTLLCGVAGLLGVLAALIAIRKRRWVLAGLVVAVAGLAAWAGVIEPERLVVRQVTVESDQWSGPPLRIGVISDTHVGAPHGRVSRVQALVRRMNAETPDIVVLLGDYAGGHEPEAVRSAPARSAVLNGVTALGQLNAPLGVYAVLGNHDAWYGPASIKAALAGGKIPALDNDGVLVEHDGRRFFVGGLAEMSRSRASVPLTLSTAPADAPVILLSHYPDPFPQVPGRVALMLAGHSHCGQINLPIVGRPIASSRGAARWPCGLYDEGGRKLFVTGGVGTSALPFRFGATPEIDVVTLRAKRPSA